MDFREFNKFQKREVREISARPPDTPLISVCVQTYQHSNFIRECLEGILLQNTDFSFEILLGEDDSSDGTREICKEYAEKYPDKIRLFLHHRENNIWVGDQPTGRFNFLYNMFSAKGKYIALCEGDDYWTDPLKLQKQVDFLETNPYYGICFHNVRQLSSFNENSVIIPGVESDKDFNLEEYIIRNRTATCSMVFRRKYIDPLPQWFMKVPFGDLGIILFILKKTNLKGKVLKETMGVYRIHEDSTHGKFQKDDRGLIKAYKQHLMFNKIIKKDFLKDPCYNKILARKYYETYKVLAGLYKGQKDGFNYLRSKAWMKYYQIIKN